MNKLTWALLSIALTLNSSLRPQEIFQAIRQDSTRWVKAIVQADPGSIESRMEGVFTPLNYASRLGREEIVKLLIDLGARVNPTDHSVMTPILYAVHRAHFPVVEALCQAGARLDEVTLSMSLLHHAVLKNNLEIAGYLLAQGMDVNIRDAYGLTPLHTAVELGQKEMCEMLLERGADLTLRDHSGATPLHLARETGRKELAQWLLSKGAEDVPRNFPELSGRYMGTSEPENELIPFPPNGVMRVIGPHSGIAVAPGGREIVWIRGDYTSQLWHMKERNGRWSIPRRLPFSGDFNNASPCFSGDGKRLYFASDRPCQEEDAGNIWAVDKEGDGWGDPVNIGSGGNAEGLSIDREGRLYFANIVRDAGLKVDVYRTDLVNGVFQKAVPIDTTVNSPLFEVNPFIAPDGSYLIFNSQRFGNMTICVSFRGRDGSWSPARDIKHLFAPFMNTYVQGITGDGKYILYAGETKRSWEIYRVSSQIIDDLRRE